VTDLQEKLCRVIVATAPAVFRSVFHRSTAQMIRETMDLWDGCPKTAAIAEHDAVRHDREADAAEAEVELITKAVLESSP